MTSSKIDHRTSGVPAANRCDELLAQAHRPFGQQVESEDAVSVPFKWC